MLVRCRRESASTKIDRERIEQKARESCERRYNSSLIVMGVSVSGDELFPLMPTLILGSYGDYE